VEIAAGQAAQSVQKLMMMILQSFLEPVGRNFPNLQPGIKKVFALDSVVSPIRVPVDRAMDSLSALVLKAGPARIRKRKAGRGDGADVSTHL